MVPSMIYVLLFTEIPVQEALERLAVTGSLGISHFRPHTCFSSKPIPTYWWNPIVFMQGERDGSLVLPARNRRYQLCITFWQDGRYNIGIVGNTRCLWLTKPVEILNSLHTAYNALFTTLMILSIPTAVVMLFPCLWDYRCRVGPIALPVE